MNLHLNFFLHFWKWKFKLLPYNWTLFHDCISASRFEMKYSFNHFPIQYVLKIKKTMWSNIWQPCTATTGHQGLNFIAFWTGSHLFGFFMKLRCCCSLEVWVNVIEARSFFLSHFEISGTHLREWFVLLMCVYAYEIRNMFRL